MKPWLLLIPLLLTGCQTPVPAGPQPGDKDWAPGSDRYSQQQDAAPENRDAVLQTADPVPAAEPRSKYGNHSPYSVFGVTYTVMGSAAGYVEEGNASWYGSKFHGHRTSSGEAYDMYKLSAAHKTLPLPTWARVTNLDNGNSTIVRVNDRGPFHSERIIDLSWAAAVKLGIDQKGTGRVRVEALTPAAPASPTTVAAAVASPPPAAEGMFLQMGAFSQSGSAETLVGELISRFQWPVAVRPADTLYRVWMGPFSTAAERDQARQALAAAGYQAVNINP